MNTVCLESVVGGSVRQPSLQYGWALIQRLGERQVRMREENIERTGEKGRQPREKLKGGWGAIQSQSVGG